MHLGLIIVCPLRAYVDRIGVPTCGYQVDASCAVLRLLFHSHKDNIISYLQGIDYSIVSNIQLLPYFPLPDAISVTTADAVAATDAMLAFSGWIEVLGIDIFIFGVVIDGSLIFGIFGIGWFLNASGLIDW